MFESLLRKSVLFVAESAPVRNLFMSHGMKLGVSRFVAAETLSETLRKVMELNAEGLLVTLDYLGESILDPLQAAEAADMICGLFQVIERMGLRANVSVKLSQLGLTIDPDGCRTHMERILQEANEYGNFVRIDMENSTVTQRTLDLFYWLLDRFGSDRVGIVLQSYLYRSIQDASGIRAAGANLRIVKGAYHEPPDIAYSNKSEVDAAYMRLVQSHLKSGSYTAVATHDRTIVAEVIRYAREEKLSRDRFEFQMLYGIANDMQRDLSRSGYQVRVYTPFGSHWYPYFTRRIAERPANLIFIAKHIFRS